MGQTRMEEDMDGQDQGWMGTWMDRVINGWGLGMGQGQRCMGLDSKHPELEHIHLPSSWISTALSVMGGLESGIGYWHGIWNTLQPPLGFCLGFSPSIKGEM